jgi:hypothetical protein
MSALFEDKTMTYVHLRKFVKKHERKFVIVGAILAASSLLLREVVREDLRDLRDSLSGAKTIYIINTGFVSLYRQIAEPGGRLYQAINPAGETAEREEYRIVSSVEAFEAEIDNMEHLIKAIDPSPEDKATMARMEQESDAIESEFEKAARIEDNQKKVAALRQIEEKVQSEEQGSFTWEGSILNEAEVQEDSRTKTYDSVTHVTYGLLIVGTILSLLGQIMNVKGLAGAE